MAPGALLVLQVRHGAAEWLQLTGKLDARAATSDDRRNRGFVLYTSRCETGRDPVVARVGRMLGATRLDRAPLLWRVLAGDISIVENAWRSIRLFLLATGTGHWQPGFTWRPPVGSR